MTLFFTEPFKKDYEKLPLKVKRALDKALKFLLQNPNHPSLQTKKLPNTLIWYARLTQAYRFTFEYKGDYLVLRRVGAHKILNHERKSNR